MRLCQPLLEDCVLAVDVPAWDAGTWRDEGTGLCGSRDLELPWLGCEKRVLCWLSGNVGRSQLTAVDSVPAAAAVGRMYESAVCCLRPPYNNWSQCGHSFSFISPDTDIAAGYKNFTAVSCWARRRLYKRVLACCISTG